MNWRRGPEAHLQRHLCAPPPVHALAILLLWPALLAAGTIEGQVKDPSGAAIPGAAVTLQNPTQSQSAQTDAQGHFAFTAAAGTYALTIQLAGFELFERSVEVGERPVALSITLKIAAQETVVEVTGKRSGLANADPNYLALRNAAPTGCYRVHNLVLERDVARFTFAAGSFSFVPAVEGRVVAAVFIGEGSLHLEPAMHLERDYLRLITGYGDVDEPFHAVVLWFTDDTYAEITRQAQVCNEPSQAAGAWNEFHSRARRRTETPGSFMQYLLQYEYVKNQEAEILGEIYNPKEAGSFNAYIRGNKHADLRFLINRRGALPYLPSPEEVALVNLDTSGEQDGIWYLTHFAGEWKSGQPSSMESRHIVQAERYRIETAIGKNDHLSATCLLRFKALLGGVRVINPGLLPSLRVLRVAYHDREIPFIQERRKEDGSFYIIMPEPLAQDQSYEVRIEYEGNKVLRKAGSGNYAVGARTSWYPSLNAFLDRATYDLTFKVPKQYTLVGVGKLVKEWREDDYAASNWVSETPLAVAGFNYGLYKKKSLHDNQSKYDVEVYATSDVPDYLRRPDLGLGPSGQTEQNLSPTRLAEGALVDAQNAIRLFQAWFGDAPYGRIAITQQPQFNFGQSWPTLVYLPVSAFLDSTQRWMLMGGNAFKFADFIQEVTPHEVSHQWWGHMVGWATYHDQWLSEGFADFSAGLYLQQVDHDQNKFLKFWERDRDAILQKNNFGMRAEDAGPLWMGIRLNTFKTGEAYRRLVYPKGGYVLHMLRYLMYDREKGDQDFISMMHDFVRTYLHRNASTESFQSVVEKHMKPSLDLQHNGSMNWFFKEWVFGTEVPGYRLEYTLTPEAGGKYLFTGKVSQSGVSGSFVMAVPLYFDFDGHVVRAAQIALTGTTTTNEFTIHLPKKPKRVLLNANHDVLAVQTVEKQS